MFISSHPRLCALPFHHFAHLLSRSPSLYRSRSVSLGSGIHRHSVDGTRTQDTSQHHRHVRLWDPCCSRWGPRSCCLHQHQGWPGQMVGNENERVVNACSSPLVEGLLSWPLTLDTSKMIFQSPFKFTPNDQASVLKTCPVTLLSCTKAHFPKFGSDLSWCRPSDGILMRAMLKNMASVEIKDANGVWPFRYMGSRLWELGGGGPCRLWAIRVLIMCAAASCGWIFTHTHEWRLGICLHHYPPSRIHCMAGFGCLRTTTLGGFIYIYIHNLFFFLHLYAKRWYPLVH